MITRNSSTIPGLTKIVLSDGTARWQLTTYVRGHRHTRRHQSLEEAVHRYQTEQIGQALLEWPPFSDAEQRALLGLRKKVGHLIPLLSPLLQAVGPTHGSALHSSRGRKPPTHQQGLPANQCQTGTGGNVDPHILFHAYARRWFETSKSRWSQDSQDIQRSLCTRHLNPAFGHHQMRNITVEMVATWLTDQLEHYSLVQCRHMRTALASICYAAMADGLITTNPATDPRCMLPTETTRQRLLTTL